MYTLSSDDAAALGRRIREIMDEQGFKVRELASKLNKIHMARTGKKYKSYQTIQRTIQGKRRLNPFELSLYAECFNLSSERILQSDNAADLENAKFDIRKDTNLVSALEIVDKALSASIGVTEKAKNLLLRAKALHSLKRLEEALEALDQSILLAKQAEDAQELMYMIYETRALVFNSMRNDEAFFENAEAAQEYLVDDPYFLGRFQNIQCGCSILRKDYKSATRYTFQAIRSFLAVDNQSAAVRINIGRLLNNIGEIQLIKGRYKRALSFYFRAEQIIEGDSELYKLSLNKSIIKALMSLDRLDEAKERINKAMENLPTENQEIVTRYLLLYAYVNKDKASALKVTQMKGLQDQIYYFAYRILLSVSLELNSDVELLEYYTKTIEYSELGKKRFYQEDWF